MMTDAPPAPLRCLIALLTSNVRNTVNQASESVQGAMSGASKQGNEGTI